MAFDLIHRHTQENTVLTLDDVRSTCPAAFTDHAAPETSGRYGFVNTLQAIDILADHNFRPVRAIQTPVRKAGSEKYAAHMLTFSTVGNVADLEFRPEIILYNSHNARSSLKLFAGCFRFICSNGLVAGEGFQSRMRHSKLTADAFCNLVKEQADNLPAMMHRVERLRETNLTSRDSDTAVLNFVQNAANLRWENAPDQEKIDSLKVTGSYVNNSTLRDLYTVHRSEDRGANAWKIFNRVQESLLAGNVTVTSFSKRHPFGTFRRSRGVAALAENIRINRRLWDLADNLV